MSEAAPSFQTTHVEIRGDRAWIVKDDQGRLWRVDPDSGTARLVKFEDVGEA